MRLNLLLFFLLVLNESRFLAQGWIRTYERPKCFIENLGQFDAEENEWTGPILYAADFGKARVFFGKKGIQYRFLDAEKKKQEDSDGLPMESKKDHKQWEREYGKYLYRSDEINVAFEQAASTEIEGKGAHRDYFSYSYKGRDGVQKKVDKARGFDQIVYKNIVPGIDLVYNIHPSSGLKYALTVHPKADVSRFKMHFDRNVNLVDQALHITTLFGDWIDHSPISFYDYSGGAVIPSSFLVQGERTVSFQLGKHDSSKTVIIDPWTQLPSFPSNWDCIWECEKDASGNIYAIGGVMPMQLLKYNPSGTLQWTYNTPYDTANVWLGTLAVDNAGNAYLTAGSVAAIQKINTNGALVWDNPNPGGFLSNDEFWSITFNCDQSKLVVGGTGGAALNLTASVYDIDVNTGNVTANLDLAQGSTFGIPPSVQEVRAICASPNGKYYFLTQDTVGAINQNLNACGGNALFYKIDNAYDWGYKCENYRYDNAGICAIKANNSFFYTQNGVNLAKRDLQTGAILASVAIPGGANTTALGDFSVSNSGIDIDDCGNIYVGSTNGVVKFDANLVQLATFPTSFRVYDVHVTLAGEIVAAGSTGNASNPIRTGYLQTFTAGACAPLNSACCDASICGVQSVCVTDAQFSLTAATPGGIWSGPGISAAGVFNPSVAGVGNQTITYTLPCGSESVTLVVSPCQGLTACIEPNGSITVSGGVAPYNWAYYQAAQSTPITNQAECTSCGFTWFFGQCLNGVFPVTSCNTPAQWVNFATGTNAAIPNGVSQVQVTDASGTIQVFTLSSLSPCTPNPCPPIALTVTGSTNVTCNGLADGQATVLAQGGTAPYSYVWMPGNLNGANQSGLSAGTYTVTALDQNNCTGDTTVTITQPNPLQINAPNIMGTQCGSSTGAIEVAVIGGSGNYTYAWNPNVGSGNYIQNLSGGSYSVVVTDQNSGCSATAQFNVPSLGGPVLNNPILAEVLCFGGSTGSIQVTAGGATPPYQFQVNNGPFQNTGTFTGLSAGQYQITAQDATGCENSLVVTLNEPSALQAFLPTTIPLCSGDSVLLNANVNGGVSGYTYQWSNGATVHPLTVSVSQTTPLTLEVIDGNGCSTTASVLLELIPCGNIVYTIPNVFSPNGDGTNDQYGIFSLNVLSQEAVIVNRWGEVMLELNQVNQLWDGSLPNGDEAKEGVYFMKFRLMGLGGEEQQGHVFFHLVR